MNQRVFARWFSAASIPLWYCDSDLAQLFCLIAAVSSSTRLSANDPYMSRKCAAYFGDRLVRLGNIIARKFV
jgi:hypothetical protein